MEVQGTLQDIMNSEVFFFQTELKMSLQMYTFISQAGLCSQWMLKSV